MAALHEIARQYAEEIRDGIAWVIIWKTGRSWHAESVWLNQDSDTFELEDLSTAAEILEQDPNAVMVNGYYCGHFGENMTIAELEAGILWHYEGGCNLLKNSTAFPPEPIPRPENLPADMPWYGKETTEEPDPYIFDGYMSVEDYEKRQQLIAADQARSDPLPDESPPEPQHTELTIQIGPPAATVLLDALADVAALFEVCKAMDAERSDLLNYVNVFGYNPKYGVSGKRIEKVAYWPQNFNKYMQAPSYTLPAKLRQRRR